ncbi:MAG: DUF1217 domain-containing protein [Henriciella sp.]|nr:DUF1217 domain-containing protein [Hyphomonadaceae bacterium]
MVFQPVIPLSGLGGWSFLQSTYDQQLETYSNSAQIKNDIDYFTEKLSAPIAVEDFVTDGRLRRIGLTAFGLGEEAWKTGYIRTVLEEVQDPESTFLARLNNAAYSDFADAFRPNSNGTISLTSAQVQTLASQFASESFEQAVGEQDNAMRLSLNFQAEVPKLVTEGSTDQTVLYRLLGSVPVRTVLETALGLPTEFSALDLDKQAEILDEELQKKFGLSSIQDLTEPETMERMVQRFQVLESLNQGVTATGSAATALTLLRNASGFGAIASQNLFLSNF